MFIQTKYDMMTDISDTERRKVFKDIGFMTDRHVAMNLSQWTKNVLLYLPAPLLCLRSASSRPTAEWSIACHYQGSSRDSNAWQALMKPKPVHGGKLVLMSCAVEVQDVCAVLPAFMQSKSVQWGHQYKALFGHPHCVSTLSWEHASPKLKHSELELLYIKKG